jgi:hypothetical protein
MTDSNLTDSNLNGRGVNKPSVSKPSVTGLYRRFGGKSDVASAGRIDAQVASSSARAELARLQRDLEPASAQLSADLAVLFAADGNAAHVRNHWSRGTARAPRRWVAAAALAASLIAAVAFWGVYRAPPAPLAAAHALPDRIFAGFDERAVASKPGGDEIFRAEFRSDEIFNSSGKTHDG